MFEEPSPKRRKGDNMPPTAEDIARSNDHLHQLGVKRRSWMTGGTGPIPPPKKSAPATSAGPKDSRPVLSPTTSTTANAAAVASNARIPSWGNAQQQPPKRPIADLVDYELPTDRLGDQIGLQRKEGATNHRATLLPSPSPSEETARSPLTGQLGSNPPTPAIAQAAANAQRSASRNGNVRIGSAGVPYTVPSNLPLQQTAVANPSRNTIPRQPTHRASVPSNVVPKRHTPVVPTQNATASPSLTHQRSMGDSAPAPLGQQEHQQRLVQIPAQQHHLASMPFYRKDVAMKHVDIFESLLRQSTLGRFSESDMGRLYLVRQAVQNMDWFYVILNQVYCLRTINPDALPRPLAALAEISWLYLASLLCDNRTLNPEFNHWSSMFPDGLSNIPRQWHPAYEWYLHRVHSFLQALPLHWDNIVAESRVRLAPPLVQELVDRMGIIGPTLQTTAFRCIARNFWPATGGQPGLEQLEAIHQKDQMSFAKGERLDPNRQNTTYAIYRGIFREWNANHAMSPTVAVMNPPNAQLQQTIPVQAHSDHAIQRPPSRPGAFSVQQQHPHQQTALRQNSMAMPQQVQNRVPISAAQSIPHASPSRYQGQRAQPQAQQQQVRREPKSVYPALHECPRAQPTHPDTTRVALHQAHLRSPLLGPKELPTGAENLYRHVDSFILPPKPLEPGLPVHTITFTLAPTAFAKIPQPVDTSWDVIGARPTIELNPDSRLYRLRCCKMTQTNTTNPSHWATSDNFWPEQLSFTLNDKPLSMRRKLHHGRHLPISLSPFIQRGVNTLTVSLTRTSDQSTTPFPYAISIEAVSVLSHSQLTAQIPTLPASETIAFIKKFLNPTKPTKPSKPLTATSSASVAAGNEDSDSEIEMISNTLSITLTDPYSGCLIFALPVRGRTCLHRDCFDLETFLQQRRREEPGWASAVDDWRCPICRGDARPSQLVVDGYLVDVRKALAARGALDTRAIIVGKDGGWKERVEKTTGVRSASLEVEERGERDAGMRAAEKAKQKQKRVVEVIELD